VTTLEGALARAVSAANLVPTDVATAITDCHNRRAQRTAAQHVLADGELDPST